MIPLETFYASSFGRKVDAGELEASTVNALGFMLSDKQPGKFQLEIDWIKVIRPKRERPK